jgi:hypothetical protein
MRESAKFKLVFDVIRRREIAAKNIEAQFFAVVTAHQPDEEALQTLLTIKDEAFLFDVHRYIEICKPMAVLLAKIVYELSSSEFALGLPNEQRANGILTKDGVEQSTHLFLAPDEGALDVRQPEAPILIWVI